jgi:hypothetical protein
MEIFRTKFHSTRLKGAEDADKTSFMPLSEAYLSLHRKCTDNIGPIHAMEAYSGRGETVRPAFSLALMEACDRPHVSAALASVSFNRRLSEPRNRSGHLGKREISCPC